MGPWNVSRLGLPDYQLKYSCWEYSIVYYYNVTLNKQQIIFEGKNAQNVTWDIFRHCCSVAKSCLTLQHARLPCLSLSPGVCSKSRPLSCRCHPTNSSSATLFSICLQSFPASGSFPMIWIFASGGQSIGASTSASVLPMNIQGLPHCVWEC